MLSHVGREEASHAQAASDVTLVSFYLFSGASPLRSKSRDSAPSPRPCSLEVHRLFNPVAPRPPYPRRDEMRGGRGDSSPQGLSRSMRLQGEGFLG